MLVSVRKTASRNTATLVILRVVKTGRVRNSPPGTEPPTQKRAAAGSVETCTRRYCQCQSISEALYSIFVIAKAGDWSLKIPSDLGNLTGETEGCPACWESCDPSGRGGAAAAVCQGDLFAIALLTARAPGTAQCRPCKDLVQ